MCPDSNHLNKLGHWQARFLNQGLGCQHPGEKILLGAPDSVAPITDPDLLKYIKAVLKLEHGYYREIDHLMMSDETFDIVCDRLRLAGGFVAIHPYPERAPEIVWVVALMRGGRIYNFQFNLLLDYVPFLSDDDAELPAYAELLHFGPLTETILWIHDLIRSYGGEIFVPQSLSRGRPGLNDPTTYTRMEGVGYPRWFRGETEQADEYSPSDARLALLKSLEPTDDRGPPKMESVPGPGTPPATSP